MNNNNYSAAPLIAFTAPVILALCIGIPLLIFGISAAIKFIGIMNTPLINGQVPIWSIIIIIGIFIWMKNR